jgi:hypothetical protein
MAPLSTYILVALAAILWGASVDLAKPVLAELHPVVAGGRSAFDCGGDHAGHYLHQG